MAAVKISDRCQNLSQFPGNRCLTRSRISGQDDMHRHLLMLAKTTLCPLETVLHRIGHFTDGALHLIHADILIEILQDVINGSLFRNIALNIILLHLLGISTTADEMSKDILRSLTGQMSVTKHLVLDLDLIFEETGELVIGLFGELGNTILRPEIQFTDIRQLMIAGSGNTERVFETVEDSRIALQKILQSLRQARDDYNGIVFPLIHLHKQLVERVYLIGILIGQQFLHIIKEQDTALSFLDVIVPFVNKPLVVDGIDHGQLRFLYNLLLVEIVTKDLGKHRLSRSRLTNNNSIDGYPDFCDILTRLEIGIGVHDGFQLSLHLIETDQSV